jgi:hypothetical protein
MSLFVVRLNHAVNAVGQLLQLVLDQLASGFERRLYSDWDAPRLPRSTNNLSPSWRPAPDRMP